MVSAQLTPQPTKKMANDYFSVNVVDVDRLWFTIRDAMKYLGVSRDFIDDQRKRGILQSYIVGHTVFLKKSDIDFMIESHKVHPRRSRREGAGNTFSLLSKFDSGSSGLTSTEKIKKSRRGIK